MSVSEYSVRKREAWERELRDEFGGGALPVEFVDGAGAGGGIVLGAILGLVLWLFIILATVSLVWAL